MDEFIHIDFVVSLCTLGQIFQHDVRDCADKYIYREEMIQKLWGQRGWRASKAGMYVLPKCYSLYKPPKFYSLYKPP